MSEKLLPIFSYGILRKESVIKKHLLEQGLDGVIIKPATLKGFVCYYSNGINMLFPVTDKQRQKYPNADFIVHGSTLDFNGLVRDIRELYEFFDAIELSYYRTTATTEEGDEVYVYVMNPKMRKVFYTEGLGMVIYPDSILKNHYISIADVLREEKEAEEENDNEDGHLYTHEEGKKPLPRGYPQRERQVHRFVHYPKPDYTG